MYRQPVHIVRGEGVWLWDASGKRYLDCYNNVPHVGHCHPRVVRAIMACTSSEANDIALRMARAATGATGVIATDNTYHGNTTAVSALSVRRPPIRGHPGHVRFVPAPDSLNPVGGTREGQAQAVAVNVERAIQELKAAW